MSSRTIEHVGAFNHMVLERRGIDQLGIGPHGPQIREHVQRGAQTEQARFGTLVGRGVVEFRQAHRAHQRGVSGQRLVSVSSGRGVPVL